MNVTFEVLWNLKPNCVTNNNNNESNLDEENE